MNKKTTQAIVCTAIAGLVSAAVAMTALSPAYADNHGDVKKQSKNKGKNKCKGKNGCKGHDGEHHDGEHHDEKHDEHHE